MLGEPIPAEVPTLKRPSLGERHGRDKTLAESAARAAGLIAAPGSHSEHGVRVRGVL